MANVTIKDIAIAASDGIKGVEQCPRGQRRDAEKDSEASRTDELHPQHGGEKAGQ